MRILFFLSLFCLTSITCGKVVLPAYFTDNMVLQQNTEIPTGGGPFTLTFTDGKKLQPDGTGMAVTIGIGLADNIHPKNKQEVGRRLALLALKNTYGKQLSCSASAFKACSTKGNRMEITFDHAEEGFRIKGKTPEGFIIAGPNRVFHPAEAIVRDGKIFVSSPRVAIPLAVRYAWADNPRCNLYGKNGLPVAPFRTDTWWKELEKGNMNHYSYFMMYLKPCI